MRYEGSTVPTPDHSAPADAADAAEAAEAIARSEAPTWPVEAERRRRIREARPVPSGRMREAAFSLSLVGNVILLTSLLGVLALIQMSFFAHGAVAKQPTTGFGLSGPTANSIPSPSPSSNPTALQVTPGKVQLTCASEQRTQVVTLQNTGSIVVQWHATFSPEKSGVAVSPQQGELAVGGNIPIQVQTTTKSTGPQRGSGRQGVITFMPTNWDGGQPAQLSYTTVGCH
jgi:hypothetical protein